MRFTLWHWLAAIGALVCAGFWSIEFVWRTNYSILLFLLIPCGFLYLIVYLVIALMRGKWVAPIAIFTMSMLPIAFNDQLGMAARIYWLNQDYRQCRMAIVPALRYCVEAGKSHQGADAEGVTVTRASVDVTPTGHIATIDTICGPTLETVVISSKRLTSFRSKQVKFYLQDDLGYWYFVER